MTSFPALSRSTKTDAIVTSRTIKGNSEKNALKENAPAHCSPSIRKNFFTARQRVARTRRVFWASRFAVFIWASLCLPTVVEARVTRKVAS